MMDKTFVESVIKNMYNLKMPKKIPQWVEYLYPGFYPLGRRYNQKCKKHIWILIEDDDVGDVWEVLIGTAFGCHYTYIDGEWFIDSIEYKIIECMKDVVKELKE